jgi:hypothetical protein
MSCDVSPVIFTCYDFDGTGQLTIDETTLAFKVLPPTPDARTQSLQRVVLNCRAR